MSFFSRALKVIKSAVKSPVTKFVAGGLAIAFPPVGLPASAAVVAASKALDYVKAGGEVAQQARDIISRTQAAARAGDPDAKRAVKVLKTVAAARKGNPKAQAVIKHALERERAHKRRRQALARQYFRVDRRGMVLQRRA